MEKGTLCKMARGEMVRWLAENGVTDIDSVRAFQGLGYRFDAARSTAERLGSSLLRETTCDRTAPVAK